MKLIKLVFVIIIGMVSSYIFQYVLFLLFVPDSCVYHNGKNEGFIIKTFYEINAVNGFHPEPNTINYSLTTASGFVIGILIYFRKSIK